MPKHTLPHAPMAKPAGMALLRKSSFWKNLLRKISLRHRGRRQAYGQNIIQIMNRHL